jgi:hypothetical protein
LPPEQVTDSYTGSTWFGDSKLANNGAQLYQSPTQYNWYPINFYDPREGEVRDFTPGNPSSCTPNGVMNAVELDVGNLQQWLAGKIGTNGGKVDSTSQNGYVLYFSDRRGMLPNPNGTQVAAKSTKSGDSGLEDVVNSASPIGTPNGKLEADPPNKTFSPEDPNLNGKLDNWGAANLGLGLGYNLTLPVDATAATSFTVANNINEVVNSAANPRRSSIRNRP